MWTPMKIGMRTIPTDIVPRGKGGKNTLFPYDWVIMGGGEGSWWKRFSWWVIPVGLVLVLLPYLFLFGVFGPEGEQQKSDPPLTTERSVSQPVVVQPVVVQPVVVQSQPISFPSKIEIEARVNLKTPTLPPQSQIADKPKETGRQSVWDEPTVPAPPH